MRVTGIIAEYNPFHKGHLYHLKKSRKKTNADIVIAIMSGSFVQRGEPAIVSKWARTEMALRAGCDLVIELPVAYSTQHAEIFSYYSVFLLNELKITDLFFGSESGDAKTFQVLGTKINHEKESFHHFFKIFSQDKRNSYAKALTLSIQALTGDEIALSKPNNILGLHYAISIAKINPTIHLHTIKRTTDYHEIKPKLQNKNTSATAIRKLLLSGENKDAHTWLPHFTMEILSRYTHPFLSFADCFPFFKYRLLTDDRKSLAHINSISEGIENRLIHHIHCSHADEFLKQATTKRYSTSRIKRLALQILFQHSKMRESIPYLRLLGMNQKGQNYLNQIKKELQIPLVTTFSKAPANLVSLDLKATQLYGLLAKSDELARSDFTTPPLRIE